VPSGTLDHPRPPLPPPLSQELSTEVRAGQLRAADLEAQLADSRHAAQQLVGDAAELRRVVAALDSERDTQQADLDLRAEQAAGLREELAAAHRQYSDLQRCAAGAKCAGALARAASCCWRSRPLRLRRLLQADRELRTQTTVLPT
jgi:hypothetical protein